MERDREREPHRTYIESEPERKGARLRWTGEKGEKERETMHIRERSAGRGPCARRHHSGRVRAHCGEGVAPPEGWGHGAHAHAHASQWGARQTQTHRKRERGREGEGRDREREQVHIRECSGGRGPCARSALRRRGCAPRRVGA